ncbi:EF-hand domain-containing protein [Haloferula sp. BvORR071]|uniref:EF-hand domain-containing protein n=1 Tax=Haloferula sp. BvORR071 TaxID=1396141 RepID=UPI00055966E4|nr:EF-hand domain-containing protein [Haloferula sp. BvORR071]
MKAARYSWIALLTLAVTAAGQEKPPEDKAPPAPPKEEDGHPPGGPRGPGQRGGDGRDGRDGRGEGFRRMIEAWKTADTDKDGFISPDEFAAMKRPGLLDDEKRKELFQRFDKDGDGKISTAEIENVLRKMGPGGPPLEDADANKDQKIDFDEFKTWGRVKDEPEERQREIFKRMDTDGDGVLTAKDRPQRGPGRDGRDGRDGKGGRRGGLLEMIKDHDKDGNGSLNFEEFREIPWVKGMNEDQQEDRFNEFDKNKDLKLDASDVPPPGERPDHPDRPDRPDKPKDGKKPE